MKTAEVGLGLQSDKAPAEYAALAQLAEGHGFDVISVFADLMYQPPIAALLEMARVTRRLRLGAACWNPYTLHPYEIAGQVAALDQASGGRAYLGLARGTWLGDIGVAQPRPLAHLREAVNFIQALLRGDRSGISSEIFPLAPGVGLRYRLPDRLPPLLIGTWGPRTAAYAGEVADELKIGGSANPDLVPVIRERVDAHSHARSHGRDVDLVFGAVTVVDEDGDAARARARTEVAMYLAVVAEFDPTVDLPPSLLDEVKTRVASGDHAAGGALIPDDVLDRFAFAGTPEHVADQALALIETGVHRIEFGTPHGLTDAGGIDLLGRRVLPLLGIR